MSHATTEDGVGLYYEETGSGTPLIFVHEYAGDYRSWEPQVRHFGQRYRAITFNARGYPPSDVPADLAYSQDRAADDIASLLHHLEIDRALGRHAGSIHGVVKANGGIVPAARTRSARTLSVTEREEISRGLAHHESISRIAARLQRAPSTVSREIRRHGGRRSYRAERADNRAWRNARRPKRCLLAMNLRLQAIVAEKLAQDWHRSRSAAGLWARIPTTTLCGCRPRRSTLPVTQLDEGCVDGRA